MFQQKIETSFRRHSSPIFRAFTASLGLIFRAVPQSHRYTAARWLAIFLRPLIARTRICRHQVAMGLDTSREFSLFVVLRALTRMGNIFVIPLRHEGRLAVDRAFGRDRGTMIVALHTTLTYAVYREFFDEGAPVIFMEAAPTPLLGKGGAMGRSLLAGPKLYDRAERHLAAKEAVFMMPDRAEATPRTRELLLPARPISVGLPLFEVARRTGSSVVLCCAGADRQSNIVVAWQEVSNANDDELFADMADFFGRNLPSSLAKRH